MSLGQLAVEIYGDARKIKGISHFVEIDVTGLDVIEPRKKYIFDLEHTRSRCL